MTEDKTYRQVTNDIEQFISLQDGSNFTADQLDRQFNYVTRDAKRYRWQILEDRVKKGQLEKKGTGKYRLVDGVLEEIPWQEADVTDVVEVTWPMNLEKWVKTYHQSIAIIAGEPGSGKTGFLHHFVLKNMNSPMGVNLFSNDMSPEEIKERMDNAGVYIPTPPPFKTYDRDSDFGDVVEPNAINVIDYLDMNSETYLIGEEIEKIYRKLKRGIALIAIQKKPGQKIGLGGVFSWKRAKLYLSLGMTEDGGELFHKLEIVKSRGRTDPQLNPRGMEFKFKLIGGIKFWLKEVG